MVSTVRQPASPTGLLSARTTRRRLAALAVIPVLAAGLTACDSDNKSTDTSKSLTKVVYLTAAATFGREGYVLVAKEKGFFREAGLDVEVQGGAAGDNNLKVLASGKADYAAIDFTGGLMRAGNGVFADYVFTAALNQDTIISLMAIEGRGIGRENDLPGKTMAAVPGSVPITLFPAYAKAAHIDEKSVKIVKLAFPQLTPALVQGEVDAVGLFSPGAPLVQKAINDNKITVMENGKPRPAKVIVLDYGKYIPDSYGNALVTTRKHLSDDRDQVKKFTEALVKGLRWSVDNPDAAGEIIHKTWETTDATEAAEELRILDNFVGDPAVQGKFRESKIAQAAALAQSLGLMPPQPDPATFPRTFIDFDIMGAAPVGGVG